MEWLICLTVGSCSGLVMGLLGAGGGWVIIPALMFGLPYAGISGPDVIKIAIASTHAINFFTSISTARSYAEKQNVDWTALSRMLPGTLVGVVAGAALAANVDVTVVRLLFVSAALYMAFRMAEIRKKEALPFVPLAGTANLSTKGLAVGGLVGAVGAGGLSVPLFLKYMPVHRAIGTASAITLPVSVFACATFAFAHVPASCPSGCVGYVYLPAVCATGVAAVLTAPLGAFLAHAMPVQTLKRTFAGILVIVAVNIGKKTLPDATDVTREAKFALAQVLPDRSFCRDRKALSVLRLTTH